MGLLGIDMQNRLYRFTTDSVEVYIESYKGFDKVRIRAGKVEKCKADFTFEVTGLTVDFTSKLTLPATRVFWNFGDNQFSLVSNPSHTYEEAGVYTVTLKGYEPGDDPSISAPILFSVENRNAANTIISNADAYNNFTLIPWDAPTTPSATPVFADSIYEVVYQVFGGAMPPPPTWKYDARRLTVTIPLDALSSSPSVINGKALIWIEGNYLRLRVSDDIAADPIIKTISGSELGLSLTKPRILPQELIAAEIDVNTAMVESRFSIIDANDNDLWPILPDPAPNHSNSWGAGSIRPDYELKMRPYKCLATKTKTITVT